HGADAPGVFCFGRFASTGNAGCFGFVADDRTRGYLISFGSRVEYFVGALTVNHLIVDACHQRIAEQGLPLLCRDRPELAAWRNNEDTLGFAGPAFGIEKTDQGL